MRPIAHFLSAVVLLALAACRDEKLPTATNPDSDRPKPPPAVVGLYEFEVSGISGGEMTSALLPAGRGPAAAVTPASSGIVFEAIGSTSLVEGTRTNGGHRYISFTYRVRNSTGAPLTNLTMLLVERPGTVAGTPLSTLRRFDGTAANPAIAAQVVPTGAVALASDLVGMQGIYPDVLQVLTESEVGAITKPADVTNIFPVGYVVRNALTNANRTLPHTTDPNQLDGILTLSFRVPLQATSSADVFSFIFQVLAVTDTETRLTESIEEARDTAAVRRLRDRATALGATTVTVLNGSPAMDPAVTDYPGQRQLCSVRTAGTAGSPTTTITAPAAYTRLAVYRPGETVDACGANFTAGTTGRPATNVPFTLTLRAMDRYGNLKSGTVDTVRLEQSSGPTATVGASAAMSGGAAALNVTWADYGTSSLNAIGKRNRSSTSILVAGVTRTWTAGAGTTDWHNNANWSPAAIPMSQDSVYVPVSPAGGAFFPALAANVSVQGVTVENAATISLTAFDLTAGGNVAASSTFSTGGITSTTGRLVLTGTARTVSGILPRMRVTGTYSLTANVNAVAPLEVSAGRVTNGTFRVSVAN